MRELLPLFLTLTGRRVVVVGAGPVGASKLKALLAAGADVTVVAPSIHADVETRRAEVESANAGGSVTIVRREFRPEDLDGAWFVVAAAPAEVNRAVAAAGEARRLFVNAVDDPPNASAYLGGVVRRAGVTVAISTDGQAPALAGLLREAFDSLLPEELDDWMNVARDIRPQWRRDGIPMDARRPLLLQALNQLYEARR